MYGKESEITQEAAKTLITKEQELRRVKLQVQREQRKEKNRVTKTYGSRLKGIEQDIKRVRKYAIDMVTQKIYYKLRKEIVEQEKANKKNKSTNKPAAGGTEKIEQPAPESKGLNNPTHPNNEKNNDMEEVIENGE